MADKTNFRWRRGVTYPLVLVWAFAGIAVKQSETTPVMVTGIAAAVLLLVILVGARLRREAEPA